MWESRSDFQGLWEGRATWFWFSSLSIARHFHSPPRFSRATPLGQTSEQLAFRLLHFRCGQRVRLRCRTLRKLIHGEIRSQESGDAGELPQNLPRSRIPPVEALKLALGRG